MGGEESRTERISAQLQSMAHERRREAKRLHQEFLALDERQKDFEASLPSTLQATEVRKENDALGQELQKLLEGSENWEDEETQKARLQRHQQEAEMAQLQVQLAKADEEGCLLEEEFAKLQSSLA